MNFITYQKFLLKTKLKKKGYDVNEMDAILLRKIEEMHLILIKQNNILNSMLKCIKKE